MTDSASPQKKLRIGSLTQQKQDDNITHYISGNSRSSQSDFAIFKFDEELRRDVSRNFPVTPIYVKGRNR